MLQAYARLIFNNTHSIAIGVNDSTQPTPPIPPSNDKLKLVVKTTSAYKNVGIYSAKRDNASKPIIIDWGDGTIEKIDGDVSQKIHTYTSIETFNVTIENIKSYVASNSTNWSLISQNGFTLKEVVMPTSIISIEASAFRNCTGLTSVTIPDSVTSVGQSAFAYCSGLTSVTIGNGMTSIGQSTFEGCSGLTSVTIPDSVTSIKAYAFRDCIGLTSVTIPDSVMSIENGAFSKCRSLTNVTISDGVTSIGDYAFSDCSSLKNVTIPDGVTSIGKYAFAYCSDLADITIPDSVTSIRNSAFFGLDSLTVMNMPGFTIDEVKNNVLNWELGVASDYSKIMVLIHCKDGAFVLNEDHDDSSGS